MELVSQFITNLQYTRPRIIISRMASMTKSNNGALNTVSGPYDYCSNADCKSKVITLITKATLADDYSILYYEIYNNCVMDILRRIDQY
jgi:hypothetical protein